MGAWRTVFCRWAGNQPETRVSPGFLPGGPRSARAGPRPAGGFTTLSRVPSPPGPSTGGRRRPAAGGPGVTADHHRRLRPTGPCATADSSHSSPRAFRPVPGEIQRSENGRGPAPVSSSSARPGPGRVQTLPSPRPSTGRPAGAWCNRTITAGFHRPPLRASPRHGGRRNAALGGGRRHGRPP